MNRRLRLGDFLLLIWLALAAEMLNRAARTAARLDANPVLPHLQAAATAVHGALDATRPG